MAIVEVQVHRVGNIGIAGKGEAQSMVDKGAATVVRDPKAP